MNRWWLQIFPGFLKPQCQSLWLIKLQYCMSVTHNLHDEFCIDFLDPPTRLLCSQQLWVALWWHRFGSDCFSAFGSSELLYMLGSSRPPPYSHEMPWLLAKMLLCISFLSLLSLRWAARIMGAPCPCRRENYGWAAVQIARSFTATCVRIQSCVSG